MFRFDANRRVQLCDDFARRDFLHAGALSMLGISLTDAFQLKAMGATTPAGGTELFAYVPSALFQGPSGSPNVGYASSRGAGSCSVSA